MFLNLTLLFTRLFSDPLRPSELAMCLGNLSLTVFDVLSHRTSVFLLLLFICLGNRPLILSKYNRLKVFTAVQRKCLRLQEKHFLCWAVGLSGLMVEPNRAVLCSESKNKVPKEGDLHGWIEDKTKDQPFYCSPMHQKRRSPWLPIVFWGFCLFYEWKRI